MKPKRPPQHLRRAAYWLDDYARGLQEGYTIVGTSIWCGHGADRAKADAEEMRALAKFLRRMAKDVA